MEETINLNITDNQVDYLDLILSNDYLAPVFKKQEGKKFISFRIDNEEYPDTLIKLYNNSSLHRGICDYKIAQTIGKGALVDPSSALYKETELFLDNINDNNENINDILIKLATDYIIFKEYAFLIKYNATWDKISIEHIDFSKLRPETCDQYGKINGYYYSWDWTKEKNKKTYIPIYDPNISLKAKENLQKGNIKEFSNFKNCYTQIYVYKRYSPNSFYFSSPDYSGAINAIKTDIITDQYGLSSFENGLIADFHINVIGNFTDEQKKKWVNQFLKIYTGASKGRKPIITFSKDKDSVVTLDKLQTDAPNKLFSSINENSTQKILSGHRVTSPMLMGIMVPGSLGGSDQIFEAQEIFYQNVIKEYQKDITIGINKILNNMQLEPISIERLDFIMTLDQKTKEETNQDNIDNNNEIK